MFLRQMYQDSVDDVREDLAEEGINLNGWQGKVINASVAVVVGFELAVVTVTILGVKAISHLIARRARTRARVAEMRRWN